MKANLLLFFLISLFSKYCFSQTYPTIRESRPRVLLSEDKFDILKTHFTNPSNERANYLFSRIGYYNSVVYNYYLRGQLHGSPTGSTGFNLTGSESSWKWDWSKRGYAINALSLILLYYNLDIEKEAQVRRIDFITRKFLEFIDKKHLNGQSVIEYNPKGADRWVADYEWKLRQIADFGSLLLDWGYDLIDHNALNPIDPNSLRKQLVDKLWEVNFSFMKVWVYRTDGSNPAINYPNDNFVGGHGLYNNSLNTKLVIALKHSKELTQEQESSLDVRFRFLFDNLINEFIPIFKYYLDDNGDGLYGENEGGDENGAAYSYVRSNFFIEYFDIINAGTDKKIYLDNPWVNNYINQFSSLIRPDKSTLHLGDDLKWFPNRYTFTILSLSNHFNLDKNKWMLQEYINNSSQYDKTVEEIFFRDDFSVFIAPDANPFPLEWFSKKTGHSVIKTSNEPTATMISYTNRPINKNNHQHLDNNSFTIYKNGPLFIDAGVYDSYNTKHYKNFYRRTIAHNSITVHDPVENFGDNISNDGGQLVTNDLANYVKVSNSYSSDSWKQYSNMVNFVYHITDASSSYSDSKVESYIRKFLYIKSEDRVIIIDYIKQPNLDQKLKVRWNAHFKNKPEVYNINETKQAPYSTAIVANDSILIERYKYDPKYKVSNSSGGNATIKTLFPIMSDNEVKLIGSNHHDSIDRGCYYIYGEDDEEGENYQPTYKEEGKNITDGAKWRLEVSSINKKKYNIFLNTIAIGDDDNESANDSKLISNQDNTMTVGWKNDLYAFGINYYGNNNISHVVNLSKLEPDTHYNLNAFDLAPNTQYYFRRGNGPCKEAISNNEGFVKFNFYYDGNVNGGDVEILTACPNLNYKLQGIKNKTLIKVYPNTIKFGEKLTISVIGNENITENEFRIYDLTGKLLMTKKEIENEIIINNFNLQKGIYILEMKNSYRKITKKIIVN